MGDNEINGSNFDGHWDVAVGCGVHRLMGGHTLGFTRSHLMMPWGECSHRIAEASTMVNDRSKTQNTNKKLYLAS